MSGEITISTICDCGHKVYDNQKFCDECGSPMDWGSTETTKSIENNEHYGAITCTNCGYYFLFETVKPVINCIRCGKEHDITSYPTKEGVQNGTDI